MNEPTSTSHSAPAGRRSQPARPERLVVRGLMGEISTLPVRDLVILLGNKQATGALHLERGRVKKKVILRDGRIRASSSNDPREYLGQLLITFGDVTEQQYEMASETQKETKIFFGKILVMTGQVSEERVKEVLAIKARESLLESFTWKDGNFSFDPSGAGDAPEGMDLQVELVDVHREGELRERAWRAVRKTFPSGALRLNVVESRVDEALPAGSLDARILDLLRERQSIDDVLLSLHAMDFLVYQRLYAFHRQGVVVVADDARSTPSAGVVATARAATEAAIPLPGPGEAFRLDAELKHLLLSGQSAEAEARAKAAEVSGEIDDAGAMVRRAEEAVLTELRAQFYEAGRLPSLRISSKELFSMEVSAPERYLLSRIDGKRSVETIIRVSPIAELQALLLFSGFVGAGFVSLSLLGQSGPGRAPATRGEAE